MSFKFLNKSDFVLIKRLLKYIKPYIVRFILSFCCVLSSLIFELIQPLVWGKFLTALFNRDFHQMLLCIFYSSILYVLQAMMGLAQSYLFAFLSNNIVYDLKKDMYSKMLNLPIDKFDAMRVGDFVSRLHEDASTIANIITNQLVNTIVDILKVAIIGIIIFKISIVLSVIILSSFPISYYIFIHYGKKIRQRTKEIMKINDNYFSDIHQTLTGIREVRSIGITKNRINSFLSFSSMLKEKSVKLTLVSSFSQTLSQFLSFTSQIGVMLIGGYMTYLNKLPVQYFIAFSSYSNQFGNSLMNLTRINSNLQQMLTSLDRIFDLMDELSNSKGLYGSASTKNINGNIKFENVYFEYERNKPILNNISFNIKENSKIAIVGNSGCGKTTVFNLLLRLYEPNSGTIRIDNININEFKEEAFRSLISVVRQDPYLFNMSIKHNLLLVKASASDFEIQNACKLANIHDFIMELPDNYNSILGENGVNLSGGQRQRLAIARALLINSSIILFDEATSALDNESQEFIKRSIDNISKDHTIIIIAHRLSTIIDADEIFVMENGNITAKGTHEYLKMNSEAYKRLYIYEINC